MRALLGLLLLAVPVPAQAASFALRQWVYRVAAPPLNQLDQDWGDALRDGAVGRDQAVMWQGPAVPIEIDLGGWCELTGARLYQHRPSSEFGELELKLAARRGERWSYLEPPIDVVRSRDKVDATWVVQLGRLRTDALRFELTAEQLALSELELTGRRLGPRPLLGWTCDAGEQAARLSDGRLDADAAGVWREPTVTLELDLGGWCELIAIECHERRARREGYGQMRLEAHSDGRWSEVSSHGGEAVTGDEPVYRLPLPNLRCDRLRLVYEQVRQLAVREIELYGIRLGEAAPGTADPTPLSDVDGPVARRGRLNGADIVTLENGRLQAVVGGDGAIMRLRRKPDGLELLGRPMTELLDGVAPRYRLDTDGTSALLRPADETAPPLTKRITIGAEPLLQVSYRLDQPDPDLTLVAPLGLAGGNQYWYPTARGARRLLAVGGEALRFEHPLGAWCAVTSDTGDGLALCASTALRCIEHRPVTGSPIADVLCHLAGGETSFTLVPIAGMRRVDSVMGDVVVGLEASTIGRRLIGTAVVQAAASATVRASLGERELAAAEVQPDTVLRLPIEADHLPRGEFTVTLSVDRNGHRLGTATTRGQVR